MKKSRKRRNDDNPLVSANDDSYSDTSDGNERPSYDDELPHAELNSLRITSQKTREQITSLERQLNRLEAANARLSNELNDLNRKIEISGKEIAEIHTEIDENKNIITEKDKKQSQFFAEFEKAKGEFDELKNHLKTEIALLTNQNSSLQHELSKQTNKRTNLNSEHSLKDKEILSLLSEIERYNANPNNLQNDSLNDSQNNLQNDSQNNSLNDPQNDSLNDSQNNNTGVNGERNSIESTQLLILENEISRLNEKSNKIKEKISQLENFLAEIENKLQTELCEAKQQQTEIEENLINEKQINEKLTKDLEKLKIEAVTIHETAELKFREQLENQKTEHTQKIQEIKQKQLASSTVNHDGEKLLQLYTKIESLKSENKTLELNLSMKKSRQDPEIQVDVVRKRHKVKMTPFSSLLPSNVNPSVYEAIDKIDSCFQGIVAFVNQKPLVRLLFIFWFIFANVFWISLLF